ncbi:MAG: AAA family ATPase [Thiolinea sp.]
MSETVVFDPANQLLLIDGERAQVSPKAFAVLDYLYQHKNQLVNKDDLLSAVWPSVFVTDAVLKVAVGELRKVLDDHPKQPRFIETVHRRGYRFIGEMASPQDTLTIEVPVVATGINNTLFGREEAVQQLNTTWANAQSGQKQILFISADAGLGKTALIDHWLEQQFSQPSERLLACAGCFDQHGSSEPYLPVLSALGNLLIGPQQNTIKPLLRQHAPSWYVQIPSLMQADEQELLKQELFGATTQRMLREFVEFIAVLTRDTPLLLCIEDLHWCDTASLDLIKALAQRQTSGRFMLMGSLRASELRQDHSAVKAVYSQLLLQQQCQALELGNLDQTAVTACLQQRLPESVNAEDYAGLFYRYTEGNPLLLSAAIDHLEQSAALTRLSSGAEQVAEDLISPEQIEQGISGGLKNLLNLKIANLDKHDRQVLEAASVSAAEFATESLAAVLQKDVLEIEDACEDHLLHEQWLAPTGSQSWPDGSISESYRFWHQLYRQFFYDTLSAARCRHYHLRFAERLLAGYQGRLNPLAAQLAYHFEAGGEFQRALEYRQQASEHAAQCFAYGEALRHSDKVFELSQRTNDSEAGLVAYKKRCGYLLASGKLMETITAYRELIGFSQQAGNQYHEIMATLGLADALFWVDRQACLETGLAAVELSNQTDDSVLQVHAQGKYTHFRSVISGYQPEYAQDYAAALQLAQESNDPELQCVHYPRHLYYLIINARYQEANTLAAKALQVASGQGDAVNYLSCEFFHAWALFYQGQWGEMLTVIERSLALAKKNEHIPWVLHFQLQKSWLLLQAGDYAGARELCQPIFQQACAGPKGSLYFFGLIILLQLEVAEHNLSESQQYVEDILGVLAEQPMAIDWVLRFSLQQGLAEYYLQREQWEAAEAAAAELAKLAACSGEKTYQVMAEMFLARCALGLGNTDSAQQALIRAEAYLQQAELPTVSWQLFALQENWQASKAGVEVLLSGLGTTPELQEAFRQSAAVQDILANS